MTVQAPVKAGAEGFALIMTVWFLVLIGAIGAFVVANGRAEVAIAANVQAAAHAEALADAGIARVVFNQTDSVRSMRWKLDGNSHAIALATGRIEIRLADEARKINPNLASEALLAALFEVRGVERGAARRLAAAIGDWVRPAPPDAAAGPDVYRAAGRNYGPPHAPLASLDELGLVLGMTPEILASVRPYLSLYNPAAAPDPKVAPLVVQRALSLAARMPGVAQDAALAPQSVATTSAPAQAGGNVQVQPGNPVVAAAKPAEEHLIEAEIIAHSGDGGEFVRYAVIKITEGGKGYSVLDWRRGTPGDASGQQR